MKTLSTAQLAHYEKIAYDLGKKAGRREVLDEIKKLPYACGKTIGYHFERNEEVRVKKKDFEGLKKQVGLSK